MKKLIALLLLSVAVTARAAGDKVNVGNHILDCDTVTHAKIGPGITLTQLVLTGSTTLHVHYITVDLSAPGVRFRTARGSGSTRLERTSSMGKRISDSKSRAIAGINGDFFDVTSTYDDGRSRPRMPMYSTIIDGEITRTTSRGHQFFVDNNGVPNIGHYSFGMSTITCGDRSVEFGGVNMMPVNSNSEYSAGDAVTMYNRNGWESPYQERYAGNCSEVSAEPLEGEYPNSVSESRYRITSSVANTGNMKIPDGGCVLIGKGRGKTFIDALKPGDIVTVSCKATLRGSDVYPVQAIGGNPLNVQYGNALESDGTRDDAVEIHPRTGVGVSRDRTKVIMMAVDGRGVSKGATTRMVGDLLVYAGAYTGMNLDGGGSTTCWTDAFGVVNIPSDKSGERTVGDALFAVVDGDVDDKNIAELQFREWTHTMDPGETWRPVVYGYNKAGVLVNTDVKGFSLSVKGGIGEVSQPGEIKAAAPGMGVVTVKLGSITADVVVKVNGDSTVTDIENTPVGGEPEYYDVNGVRVKNPSKGVYIRRKNGKTAKVII